MINIVSPTLSKVKTAQISSFLEQEAEEKYIQKRNTKLAEEEEKKAIDLYHALCNPLDSYMNSIVKNTGIKLKDVIGKYWFRTPDGLYVSTDYDTFHHIQGNRPIDPAHVAELINEFQKEGYVFNTGMVNETGGLIDGQHRIVGLDYMKKVVGQAHPFIFTILPEGNIEEIEQQNTNRNEWDWEDRLNSGIEMKLPAYEKMGQLYYEKYNKRFPLSVMIDIICGSGRTAKEDFIKRRVEISDQKLEHVIKFLDKVVEFYETIYPERKDGKISSARPTILVKLYNTNHFSYKRLLQCIESSSSMAVVNLRNAATQSKEIVCKYILDAYNHGLTTNRL